MKTKEEQREYDRERQKRWRLANPERHRAIVARSCAKHHKARLERTRKWQVENPDKVKSACRTWRINNPEKAKRSWLNWRIANAGKMREIWRFHGARKRAIKNQARIDDKLAIAKIYARCAELRKWFDVVVDHIVPLSKLGPHAPENLQIIYASENNKKRAKLDYKPKVIFT